jgi:hypothetical protein
MQRRALHMAITAKKRAWRPGKIEVQASEMARREADRQARRIPWQQLLRARHQYVEWNAFSLWVRGIVEAEGELPGWLAEIIVQRCPGLRGSRWLRSEAGSELGAQLDREIRRWVEENVLADSKYGSWMRAVTFYAVRDPVYARDRAYGQWCEMLWKQQHPSSYLSFEEWRRASECCADEVLDAFEMREDKRRILKDSRRIDSARLTAAVAEYMEWEAFTYWLRSLLEADTKFPETVRQELERRCPGFLESDQELRSELAPENYTRRWKALLEWDDNHFFPHARQEGWFDTLRFYARAHPRSVRTIDYWVFYWDEHWSTRPLDTYPSFQEWRQAADNYVVPSIEE